MLTCGAANVFGHVEAAGAGSGAAGSPAAASAAWLHSRTLKAEPKDLKDQLGLEHVPNSKK